MLPVTTGFCGMLLNYVMQLDTSTIFHLTSEFEKPTSFASEECSHPVTSGGCTGYKEPCTWLPALALRLEGSSRERRSGGLISSVGGWLGGWPPWCICRLIHRCTGTLSCTIVMFGEV